MASLSLCLCLSLSVSLSLSGSPVSNQHLCQDARWSIWRLCLSLSVSVCLPVALRLSPSLTNIYGKVHREYFGTFSSSLFTMLQIATGDKTRPRVYQMYLYAFLDPLDSLPRSSSMPIDIVPDVSVSAISLAQCFVVNDIPFLELETVADLESFKSCMNE